MLPGRLGTGETGGIPSEVPLLTVIGQPKSFNFSNFPAVYCVAFYCSGNNWFNAL